MVATICNDNVVLMLGTDFIDDNRVHGIVQKSTFFGVTGRQCFVFIVASVAVLSNINNVILVHSRTQDRTGTGHA